MKTRDQIIQAIDRLGIASPKAIAQEIGKHPDTVRQSLKRMVERGEIRPHKHTEGYYNPQTPSEDGYVRVKVEAVA